MRAYTDSHTYSQTWGVHTFSPSTRKAEAGGSPWVPGKPGLQVSETLSQSKTKTNWDFYLNDYLCILTKLFSKPHFRARKLSVSHPASQWFIIPYYCRRTVRQHVIEYSYVTMKLNKRKHTSLPSGKCLKSRQWGGRKRGVGREAHMGSSEILALTVKQNTHTTLSVFAMLSLHDLMVDIKVL